MTYKIYYDQSFECDLNYFLESFLDYESKSAGTTRENISLKLYSRNHSQYAPVPVFNAYFLFDNPKPFRAIKTSNVSYFVVALYFTVLIDQVAHCYFHTIYKRFQALTQYPKIVDNYLHCRMMSPYIILKNAPEKVNLHKALLEAIPIMHLELRNFFNRSWTVDGESFWQRCINSSLKLAADHGNKKFTELLIDSGADVNISETMTEATPLCLAVESDHYEIVKLLIHSGADVNVKGTHDRWTLLHSAQSKVMAELLIAKGLNLNANWKDGSTPLDVAIERGYVDAAITIRKLGGKTAKEMKTGMLFPVLLYCQRFPDTPPQKT